jgi:putative transposase
MNRRPRRIHTPAFKAKVALAAVKGDRTIAQLPSTLMSTPIRLRPGRLSWRVTLPEFSDLGAGCKIGRRHVKTLMRRMGIEALYRRPRTTKPEPGHKIYPYLLRGMAITRPNQVWAMDITYIPMERGFVYLAVVLDWATRRVLSWRLSITMEAAFCVETLEDALARHGKPEIFNTDQGSQFTGAAFTGLLASNGIAISMDGKGAWRDNVFVERLWRKVKYEEVYLRAYGSVGEARNSIGRYLDFLQWPPTAFEP